MKVIRHTDGEIYVNVTDVAIWLLAEQAATKLSASLIPEMAKQAAGSQATVAGLSEELRNSIVDSGIKS